MQYQIDQSGKIEDTSRLTIVAFANGKAKSLKISAVEKQKLIKIIRMAEYPKKSFVFKIFAALIFLLIKDEVVRSVVIDKEYLGNEMTIKNIILQLFRRVKLKEPEIDFDLIGKKSKAHQIAIDVFRGKRKPDMVVEAQDILAIFYK
ncbi:MAG: hypothetical protein ABH896_04565 [Candidatus Jacksonbacteria bacterium]